MFGAGSNTVEAETRWRTLTQKSGELATHFASRVMRLGFALNKSEHDQLTAFLHGLALSLRIEVFRRSPKNIQYAISAATFAESYIQESPPVSVLSTHVTQEVEQLRQQMLDLFNKFERSSANKTRDKQARPFCNYCSKPGHTELVCYSKSAQTATRPRIAPLICHYCHRPGHIQRDCKTRRRD